MRRMALGALAACSLLAASCGNATLQTSTAGNTTGVYPSKIVVGALASMTGPDPSEFAPVVSGVQAYLDMVNSEGGVNGRKIVLADVADDQSSSSLDAVQARNLVQQDHVFAIVGVGTATFTGASFLASHNVPTFGYDINSNSEWGAGPSLFGNTGSYLDFTPAGPERAYLAQQLHTRKAAVIAYDYPQSSQGCQGVVNSLRKFGIPVAYENLSVPVPVVSLTTEVQRIASAGVDLVVSCMDITGNILLSDTLQQAGLAGVHQLWFSGYNPVYLKKYPSQLNGVYFFVPQVPFEAPALYPGHYKAMTQFLHWMSRLSPPARPTQAALAGWVNADQFVTGLRAIGRDVTRERLIAAVNKMTNFTAGIMPGVDWQVAHHGDGSTDCNVFVEARAGRFVPVFASPPHVFTCFPQPYPSKDLSGPITTIPAPAGVPGG